LKRHAGRGPTREHAPGRRRSARPGPATAGERPARGSGREAAERWGEGLPAAGVGRTIVEVAKGAAEKTLTAPWQWSCVGLSHGVCRRVPSGGRRGRGSREQADSARGLLLRAHGSGFEAREDNFGRPFSRREGSRDWSGPGSRSREAVGRFMSPTCTRGAGAPDLASARVTEDIPTMARRFPPT